jgi:hypothetical protein
MLKIIGSIEINFSGDKSTLLEDVTLTSETEARSVINVKSNSSSGSSASCVIIYESVVKIENIEFGLAVDSMKEFVSLIGI